MNSGGQHSRILASWSVVIKKYLEIDPFPLRPILSCEERLEAYGIRGQNLI